MPVCVSELDLLSIEKKTRLEVMDLSQFMCAIVPQTQCQDGGYY